MPRLTMSRSTISSAPRSLAGEDRGHVRRRLLGLPLFGIAQAERPGLAVIPSGRCLQVIRHGGCWGAVGVGRDLLDLHGIAERSSGYTRLHNSGPCAAR